MIREILFKLNKPVISPHKLLTNNDQLRNKTISGILLLFFTMSIIQLVFSNNYAEAYPVEVTGKIIIEAPKCGPNEVFDPGKDKCVGTPGPGGGPGGPGGPSPKPPLGP